MRWKQPGKKPVLAVGDERVIRRFLWFPLCLNGEFRWLERTQVKQEVSLFLQNDRVVPMWENTCWLGKGDHEPCHWTDFVHDISPVTAREIKRRERNENNTNADVQEI